jgi:asparagine synthase (glutamine-hydrolysing)
MCGIVAVIDLDKRGRLPDPQLLDGMVDRLAHRGPDGRGVWRNRFACLGHRRLAIIDTGTGGHQPRVGPTGAAITFNGEIYNHVALRQRLEGMGHVFNSHSDTEVLLAAYVQWGPHALAHLRGMFAFVVVDNDRVLMGRDGFGIKPLFYSHTATGLLVVASELKALLLHPDVDRTPSMTGLGGMLATGRVPSPATAFQNIHQLPPGHVLTATVGRVDWRIQSIVDVAVVSSVRPCSDAEAVDRIDEALSDSVAAHLVSDVPVGAWLSGGVDSANVVATARRQSPLHTFSMGFAERAFDERDDAADSARQLGSDHHAGVFDGDMVAAVLRCAAFNDDALADPSLLATERLAAHSRERVAVVLSGDGADEVFAGYPLYAAAQWHRLAHPLRAPLSMTKRLFGMMPTNTARLPASALALRLVEGWSAPASGALDGFRHYLNAAQQQQWLSPALAHKDTSESARRSLHDWLRDDLRQNLVADMLVKVDRASMQHGLEVRVPYLDQAVLAAAWSLPEQQLLSRFRTKPVLRRLAQRHVGKRLAWAKKRGFSVPIALALRGPLGELLADELSSTTIRQMGLLQTTTIMNALRKHQQGHGDAAFALYAVLVLCLWWRSFGPATNTIR